MKEIWKMSQNACMCLRFQVCNRKRRKQSINGKDQDPSYLKWRRKSMLETQLLCHLCQLVIKQLNSEQQTHLCNKISFGRSLRASLQAHPYQAYSSQSLMVGSQD